MKLDINYIECILSTVEENDESRVSQEVILQALDAMSGHSTDKFYNHMMRISEAGFLRCDNPGFGFTRTIEGISLIDFDYELTWDGYQYLEAIRSDSIGSKAKDLLVDMSVEQFKQNFPALLSTLIKFGTSV